MMYAKFQGYIYLYSANTRKQEIITSKEFKARADFNKAENIFYRNVHEEELSDIYNLEICIDYDSGFPHTPKKWIINTNNVLESGKVLLRFAKGILPGWETEEKNVCRKVVDTKDIKSAKAIYTYRKKDGKTCVTPQIIEKELSINGMLSLCKDYLRENL